MNQPIDYAEIRALIFRKMHRCARYEAEGDDVAKLLCDGHDLPQFTTGPLGDGDDNGYGDGDGHGDGDGDGDGHGDGDGDGDGHGDGDGDGDGGDNGYGDGGGNGYGSGGYFF